MYDHLADFIVKRRTPILAVIGVVFVACLFTIPHLQFDFTPQQLFESTDDTHEYREIFAERFGREDNLVTILVDGEDLFDPQALEPIRDLTYELRRDDDVVDAHSVATLSLPRPDSISAEPYLTDPRGSAEDEASEVVRGPAISASDAEQLAEYAGEEPLIANRLVAADGSTALIGAWLDPEIQSATDLEEIQKRLEALIDRYELPDGMTMDVQGIPALRVTIVDQLRTEQLIFIPITAAIFLVILLFLFRRPSGVVLPLGTVIIALAATVAMLVGTDSSINIINNVLPTLIFVIGISDSIHMVTRHAEEMEVGKSHTEAVREMIRHTGLACLLTTSTTAVGFLSLLSADTQILRSFGWQAAIGVMFAYLATLFFLSASLTYMKPALRKGRHSDDGDDTTPLIERTLVAAGRRILNRPWTTVTVGLLVAGAIAIQGFNVNIDSHILEVLDEDHPSYRATETVEQELGGMLPMEISMEAEERNTFRDPEVYAAVNELQQFTADQKHVLSTESYVDYMQTARVAIVGDTGERDVMPTTSAEIEQLLLLIADAPDAEGELYDFVTSDWRNARVLARLADAGANAHLDLAEQLEERIDELFEDTDVSVRITGDAYVASAALDAFVRDLAVSLCIAIFIIFLMMAAVFRSLKIGIISLLPNCLPLLVTFGYMGYAGINLNSTTIIIFAIGLGIAVDDSIHFFARFIEEQQRTDDLKEAILRTYHGSGRAILLTSLLLLVGMGVITFSEFVPTQQFGLLIGMTITGAILADLIILPALLYIVYSRFPSTPDTGPLATEAQEGD